MFFNFMNEKHQADKKYLKIAIAGNAICGLTSATCLDIPAITGIL